MMNTEEIRKMCNIDVAIKIRRWLKDDYRSIHDKQYENSTKRCGFLWLKKRPLNEKELSYLFRRSYQYISFTEEWMVYRGILKNLNRSLRLIDNGIIDSIPELSLSDTGAFSELYAIYKTVCKEEGNP